MSEDLIERLRARCSYGDSRLTGEHDLLCDAAATEIERLRAKLAEAEAGVDSLEEEQCYYDTQLLALSKRAEAAEMRLASAKEVIAPFAEFGRSHTDEHGWIDGFGNERLCNWIGPSDLRAAAEWMEKGDE